VGDGNGWGGESGGKHVVGGGNESMG